MTGFAAKAGVAMPKRLADVTIAMTAARMVHARRCVLTPHAPPRTTRRSLTTQGAPQLCLVHRRIRDPGSTVRTRPENRIVRGCHVEVSIRLQCPPWLRASPQVSGRIAPLCATRFGRSWTSCECVLLAERWRCEFPHSARFSVWPDPRTPAVRHPMSLRPTRLRLCSWRSGGLGGPRRSSRVACRRAECGRI
jgi:hypothetical protein